MSISVCTAADQMHISENGREQDIHGTVSFPVACFALNEDRCSIIPHWHEDFELLFVLNGSCTAYVGTMRLDVKQNQGLFINSGVLHAMPTGRGCSGQFRSVVFSPRLVGGGLESIFWQKYIGPLAANSDLRAIVFDGSEPWHDAAVAAVRKAWQACADEPDGFEFAVRAALSSVMLDIVRHCSTPPVPQSRRRARSEQRVKIMMQYVHENFSEDLSLDQICAHASVSQSEALRCFKDTIGTTPMRYVKEYRLERAASLLAETDLSAGDISARCGFSDAAYFSRSFHAWSGLNPSEYRKKHCRLTHE